MSGDTKRRFSTTLDPILAERARSHAHYTSQPLTVVVETALTAYLDGLKARRIEGYDSQAQRSVIKPPGADWPEYHGALRRGRRSA